MYKDAEEDSAIFWWCAIPRKGGGAGYSSSVAGVPQRPQKSHQLGGNGWAPLTSASRDTVALATITQCLPNTLSNTCHNMCLIVTINVAQRKVTHP